MELYTATSYQLSKQLTEQYSTSFSSSSRLFAAPIRRHIYAVYGLVRIADEIVDTYRGDDAREQLDGLQADTYHALSTGYSVNPVVHAFATTARLFSIDKDLIDPFFESMRIDLSPHTYDEALYVQYIYGSAEVIGLMCLKVFTAGNAAQYDDLQEGARALGAAYQKVNFLRDCASDYKELGRLYFPEVQYETLSEEDKQAIVEDVRSDLRLAQRTITRLPSNSRKAVSLSYLYYKKVLDLLDKSSVARIKTTRIRVGSLQKLVLFIRVRSGVYSI